MRRLPDQYSMVVPSSGASSAILGRSRRMGPSARALRFVMSPRPSRSRDPVPSAATTRSAATRDLFANTRPPSGIAAIASDPVTISAPDLRAAPASALMTYCRTMLKHPRALVPVVDREDPIVLITDLPSVRKGRALDRFFESAESLEHAQPVLVDVDAGARGAQLVGALVHAHLPSALRQSTGRRQSGEPGSDDLSATRRLLRFG